MSRSSVVQIENSFRLRLFIIRILGSATAALLFAASLASAETGTIRLLPILPGQNINSCTATSVSLQLQLIVGECWDFISPVGVYWDQQLAVHQLAPGLQGADELQPIAINASGAITGSLCTSPGIGTTAYCGPGGHGQLRAFYMSSVTGAVQVIPKTSPDAPFCKVGGMNDFNQVVGYCASDNDPYAGEAFLWSPSGGIQLISGLPECRLSKANAILDDGTILGLSTDCGQQNLTEFFLVTPGGRAQQVAAQCPGLGGDTSNFAGGLAQDHSIGGSCDDHAFIVDSQGNFTSLFPADDHLFSGVYGFDNHGLALGSEGGAPFLYSIGSQTITYLSTLVPGYAIVNAWSMDSASQIVGQAATTFIPPNGTPGYIMQITP